MLTPRAARVLTCAAAVAAARVAGAGTGTAATRGPSAPATAGERVNFHKRTTRADFQAGTAAGVSALAG